MIFEKPARRLLATLPLRSLALGSIALAAPLAIAGCPSDPAPTDTGPVGMDSPTPTDDAPVASGSCLGDIEADEQLSIPGLDGAIEVVYDDRGIPHIYGTTLHDVVMVEAYLMARDRYGQMDFLRRNAAGRLSEVAGALSPDLVETDYNNRVSGYARMGRAIYESLAPTARTRRMADAFAEGVNAYIAAYDEGRENPIVEGGDLVALLLSLRVDREWRGEDIFTLARFQSASLSYDPGDDTGRSELLASALEAFPEGDPRAAIYRDLFDDLPARPVYTRICDVEPCFNDGSSMALRRPSGARGHDAARPPALVPPVETLRGAQAFFDRTEAIFASAGFGDESRGSNNWLVAANLTANDNPIMSNDPHLSLISPGVWWYVHLNTAKMGGEDMIDAEGVAFAALPGVVLGFNQNIAWGATTTGYDVTDAYLEQITAGVGGAPDTVAFDTDGDGDLEQVPIMVVDEEIVVSGMDAPVVRQVEYVTTHGPTGTLCPIIPGSRQPVEGMPGRFTAISIRYTGWEVSDELAYFANLLTATNVAEATAAQDNFRVGAQNFIVADRTSIGWSSEARIPTRPNSTDLMVAADGTMTGSCPIFVLPGQGGHEWGPDLDSRFVPHDRDPARGWIATANQDNVGVTDDGNPCNDAHYIGGGFDLGWREDRIQSELTALAARGDITTADMIDLQAESRSSMGQALAAEWAAVLDDAMTHVPGLSTAEQADVAEARTRLMAWTSFETPEATTSTDATEIADSVATTIFNGILTRVGPIGLGDEATAMGRGSFSTARVARFIEHSFVGTPEQQSRLAIYWDELTTAGTTETKEQALVRATVLAMTFLRTTLGDDVSMWRWGRLHTVRFDSVLPTVGTDILSIPREGDATYPNGFPRHGDFGSVDPGQYGLWNTTGFSFGSGASQRLVVELTETGPIAFNALPGGQSIDPNSPHKMDEALLWIRNEQPRIAFQESEIRAAADRCVVISTP